MTDLAAYRINYGTDPGNLSETVEINGVGVTTRVIENLSPGTWYFVIRAANARGAESAPSNVVSKVIP
jgi:hypothetical protein